MSAYRGARIRGNFTHDPGAMRAIVAMARGKHTTCQIDLVICDFCDRVRARKNPPGKLKESKNTDKRFCPALLRPTASFPFSHTIYTQLYPQL